MLCQLNENGDCHAGGKTLVCMRLTPEIEPERTTRGSSAQARLYHLLDNNGLDHVDWIMSIGSLLTTRTRTDVDCGGC